MTALQIRDFPDELYEELKATSVRERRSLAQQATVAIEYGLKVINGGLAQPTRPLTEEEERQIRIAKRKALFEKIHRRGEFEIPDDFPSIVEIIHEGRRENDVRLGL